VDPLFISVIIPTYNRKQFLKETLRTLAVQTFPFSCFEVIVVEDGSTDPAQEVTNGEYPFHLQYIFQANQGDAIARNTGVEKSQGELLVFLDDDILVSQDYLSAIVSGHTTTKNRIIVGMEYLWLDEERLPSVGGTAEGASTEQTELEPIDFTAVCSNNMSILRESYYAVGSMQNLDFPGSSIWCDIDFSYRACLKGFEFYRSPSAICWHRDYVSKNLENQKRRWREAAFRAVTLFEKYPLLVRQLPMFDDKIPVIWREDSASMILRKSARRVASSRAVMWTLETTEKTLRIRGAPHPFIQSLRRWIIGGTIYQGYREGLREKSLPRSQ
jgi:glycosyltransferase involved in cell wall biosynthesis